MFLRRLAYSLLLATFLCIASAEAAISFIGSASGSSAANTDTTINLPGSMAVNDLIIVACGIGDNDSINQDMVMVTSGYNEIADLLGDDETNDINFAVFYKFHNGTDTTAVCDALNAGTDAAVAGALMVFRGVDTTTPFDVASTTNTGTNTGVADPPSINHNGTAGTWTVIAGGTGANGVTAVGATYTFPTGYTTNAVSVGFDDTSDVLVGIGYRTSPADPEDPGVMTPSFTDTAGFAWAAVTMALREAAACVPDLALLGVGRC